MTKPEFIRKARTALATIDACVEGQQAFADDIRPFDPVLADKVEKVNAAFVDVKTYLKSRVEPQR